MRTPGADTLSGQAAAYLARLKAHHYSEACLDQNRLVLGRLAEYLARRGRTGVHSIREQDLVAFVRVLAHLRNRQGVPLALTSLNSYTRVLRSFFAFLETSGVLLENPAVDLPLPSINTLPKAVLSVRQARQLMQAPDAVTPHGLRDRAILETFYGTAIRLSECYRLDLDDLDLSRGLLMVRQGKGRKDRLVPLTRLAITALGSYLACRPSFLRHPGERALFLARGGRRLSRVSISLLIREYGHTIGARVSPHGLRHACATHLIKGGADVRHVQKLLGHRDLRTTAIYTRVDVSDLRQVLAKAHPRER